MLKSTFILYVMLFASANCASINRKNDYSGLEKSFERGLELFEKVKNERINKILESHLDDHENSEYYLAMQNVTKTYLYGLESKLEILHTFLEKEHRMTSCGHYFDDLRLAHNKTVTEVENCATSFIYGPLSVLNETSAYMNDIEGVMKRLIKLASNCTDERCSELKQRFADFPGSVVAHLKQRFDKYEAFYKGPRTFTTCIEKTSYPNFPDVVQSNFVAFEKCIQQEMSEMEKSKNP